MDRQDVARLVSESRRAQGLEERIHDSTALARIAELIAPVHDEKAPAHNGGLTVSRPKAETCTPVEAIIAR